MDQDQSAAEERPLPTGDRAVDARVFAPSDAVFVTEYGSIARWNGTLWRTTTLQFSCYVRSMWAKSSHDLFLLCETHGVGAPPRTWLVRVRGDVPEVIGGPISGSPRRALVGSAPNDLWAIVDDGLVEGLVHWNGNLFRVVRGPPAERLSDLLSLGPNELLLLEHWNTMLGTSRLHRFNGSEWSVFSTFAGLPYQVRPPMVLNRGSLYADALRFDIRSDGAVLRYNLTTRRGTVFASPTSESCTVFSVADALWACLANTPWCWRREGDQWVAIPALPFVPNSLLAASGPGDIWSFGRGGVARLDGDAWHPFHPRLGTVRGFWRDAIASPALVSEDPAGLETFVPADRGAWPARTFAGIGRRRLLGWATAGGDRGWLATEHGAVEVVNREEVGVVAWPDQSPLPRGVAAWDHTLWTWAADGIRQYDNGRWQDPVSLPSTWRSDQGQPIARAIHGVGPDTLIVGTASSRDGLGYADIDVLRGRTFSGVTSQRNPYSGYEVPAPRFTGVLPRVWIAVEGLSIWNGNSLRSLEAESALRDLHALPDGRAVGTDGFRVYAWTADGRQSGSVPIPPTAWVNWSFVHGAPDGTLRVASRDGAVIRYTP